MEQKILSQTEKNPPQDNAPEYDKPLIITYNADDIIEELGPAQTCSAAPACPVDIP